MVTWFVEGHHRQKQKRKTECGKPRSPVLKFVQEGISLPSLFSRCTAEDISKLSITFVLFLKMLLLTVVLLGLSA